MPTPSSHSIFVRLLLKMTVVFQKLNYTTTHICKILLLIWFCFIMLLNIWYKQKFIILWYFVVSKCKSYKYFINLIEWFFINKLLYVCSVRYLEYLFIYYKLVFFFFWSNIISLFTIINSQSVKLWCKIIHLCFISVLLKKCYFCTSIICSAL